MSGKSGGARFTIQFNGTDPAHLKTAELLNKQGHRGKAQYIVNAVLHYENGKAPGKECPAQIDETIIEAVVLRILRDKDGVVEHSAKPSKPPEFPTQTTEELHFDETVETLGEEGLHAIAGALDMFRRK